MELLFVVDEEEVVVGGNEEIEEDEKEVSLLILLLLPPLELPTTPTFWLWWEAVEALLFPLEEFRVMAAWARENLSKLKCTKYFIN